MKTCIAILVTVLLTGSAAFASDGGWILWVKTTYIGDKAELERQGFSDRWEPVDGYDTAVDCHVAAKTEQNTLASKIMNEQIVARGGSIRFVDAPHCFPLGFDPRRK